MLIEMIPKFHSSSQRGSIYLAKRSSANARGGGGGSRRRGGALGWGVRVLDPHWGCKEGKGEVVQVGCKRGGEGWRSMRGTLTGWGVERWTVQGSNYGLDWSHQCLVQKCTDAMGSWSAMLIISFIKISGIARSRIRQNGFLILSCMSSIPKTTRIQICTKMLFCHVFISGWGWSRNRRTDFSTNWWKILFPASLISLPPHAPFSHHQSW